MGGEAGKRYALRLKLRDRSGRYAESEVFSPAFTPDDSTELYACPMKCDGGNTTPLPGLCPVCGMRLHRLLDMALWYPIRPRKAAGPSTNRFFLVLELAPRDALKSTTSATPGR